MELHFNLTEKATAGAPCVLRHPVTGEELRDDDGPATLILAGKDSEQYRAAELDLQRRQLEEAKRNPRGYRLTPEQLRDQALFLLVACTLGWENFTYKGESTFSPALARQFYLQERWAADQAQGFIDERSHFLGASTTT